MIQEETAVTAASGPSQGWLRVCGSQGRRTRGQGSGQSSLELRFGQDSARWRGQGNGHRRRDGWSGGGLESRWQGQGLRWGSGKQTSLPLSNHGMPWWRCPPSLAKTRWARQLQLIPGLGGGKGGSFARVHLGGLWAWAATHRGDPPVPLISCYSVGCIRLQCECLLSWSRGLLCVASGWLWRLHLQLSPAGAEPLGSSLGNGVGRGPCILLYILGWA